VMLDSSRGSRPCLLVTGPSVQPSPDRREEQQRIPGGHSGQPQPLGRGRAAGRDRWSSGVYGHGARRLRAPLGDPAVGESAGATPQRAGQAQVAAGQGGCLCGCRGMAERTPDPVVPVLGHAEARPVGDRIRGDHLRFLIAREKTASRPGLTFASAGQVPPARTGA
jgi:hypothetical protein